MKKIQYLLLTLAVFFPTSFSQAVSYQQSRTLDSVDLRQLSAFRRIIRVEPVINVPTVVEVPFGVETFTSTVFAVVDETGQTFFPYYFKRETYSNTIPISITADSDSSGAFRMIDDKPSTYAEFPITSGTGVVEIVITSKTPIVSSSLNFLLDANVALPATVTISAKGADGATRIVVAERRVTGQIIDFPRTSSGTWTIQFEYVQPLRISELKLQQENSGITRTSAIRFLARPNGIYSIYFDADRSVVVPSGEAGNLFLDKDVKVLPYVPSVANTQYKLADVDNDGIPDNSDNCVNIENVDQTDINNNGVGDACDDYDKDGLINIKDNCPNDPNRNQADVDGDKIGDICDKEESRITEAYPWLPWVGIGFAALVVIGLFALTARSKPPTPGQV